MSEPLLLNLSLPKCGTLSVHEFFADRRSAHELYGNSVLTAIDLSRQHNNPALLTQLLRRRYGQAKLEIDASGFLHAIADELVSLYPHTYFLRVIREPRSWISSYLDMLEGKARELTHEGCLMNDRAARFEQFYLQRIAPSLRLTELIELKNWSADRFSSIVAATASYWEEHAGVALQQLNGPQIITCTLAQLSSTLPQLRTKILAEPSRNGSAQSSAQRRHNVSERGEARRLIEQWLNQAELSEGAARALQRCDDLHGKLSERLQFTAP